jgi:hypothetical protein
LHRRIDPSPEAFDVGFVKLAPDAADPDERLRASQDGRVVLVQVGQHRQPGVNGSITIFFYFGYF